MAHVPSVLSQTAQFAPGDEAPGITYRVNIPPPTAASKSGPIYFQMEAPSSLSWFALGQGTGMVGANMFVVYAASATNITVSARSGAGHVEPEHNPNARISLLEGSGIKDGKMIANVQCDNCLQWKGGELNPTDAKSPWIWAMSNGSPLNSADTSASINYHDARGAFTFDLSQAAGGSGNPPSTGSGSSGPSASTLNTKRSVHGIIMSIAFVILFPTFALSLYAIPYSKTASRIHAPLQLATLAFTIAGFGIGISLAKDFGKIAQYHPIIGMVAVGYLIAFQPALGLMHHLNYVKTHEGSVMGVVHRWGGRVMLVLGIVNGGLGFMFAGIGTEGVPVAGVAVYSAIAGFMGVVYVGLVAWKRGRKQADRGREDSVWGGNGDAVKMGRR
ncbi:hypothetical protein FQN52_002556 [Onygenales sp. PD_12]|nr:hypothetical protein FQN52_002556 [Onygenales sp. PD_12]